MIVASGRGSIGLSTIVPTGRPGGCSADGWDCEKEKQVEGAGAPAIAKAVGSIGNGRRNKW